MLRAKMVVHLRWIGAVVHLTAGSASEMATAASWGRHGAARTCDEFSDGLQFLGHKWRYAYFMPASQVWANARYRRNCAGGAGPKPLTALNRMRRWRDVLLASRGPIGAFDSIATVCINSVM
jgi:hypothetical protein